MKASAFVVPLILVAALGGVMYMVFTHDSRLGSCPGHWHSTFAVVVDGQRVQYGQPPYNLDSPGEPAGGVMPISLHMHSPDDQSLHFEPSTPSCLSVADTVRRLGTQINGDSITFTSGQSQSGTFTANATHTLRAFSSTYDGGDTRTWTSADLTTYRAYQFPRTEVPWNEFTGWDQLPHLTKVMVVYGPATDAQLDSIWNAMDNPPA
jgi:hypothetical protein